MIPFARYGHILCSWSFTHSLTHLFNHKYTRVYAPHTTYTRSTVTLAYCIFLTLQDLVSGNVWSVPVRGAQRCIPCTVVGLGVLVPGGSRGRRHHLPTGAVGGPSRDPVPRRVGTACDRGTEEGRRESTFQRGMLSNHAGIHMHVQHKYVHTHVHVHMYMRALVQNRIQSYGVLASTLLIHMYLRVRIIYMYIIHLLSYV